MRKLFLNIALFGVPFVGLLAWLLWATPDKAYSYNMIQKDCRTGSWIYRRLFEEQTAVDVAFVGTSKVMCDVNDSLLEYRLQTIHSKSMHIANFGVCRKGENLHWLITRDILAQKKPKYLIMEVSTDIPPNSHFHFPYLATTKEAIGAPIWANSDYWGDLTMLCWTRLVYQRERLLGIDRKFEDVLADSLHSFFVTKADLIADSSEMERVKKKRKVNLTQDLPTGISGWLYDARVRPAKHYYQSMVQMAKAAGTKIVFLYLPVYGVGASTPQETAFFQSMGPIWIPPDSVFRNPRLHMDDSHLNQQGARNLSDWLAQKIATLD